MNKPLAKLTLAIAGCGEFGAEMAELLQTMPTYQVVSVCDPVVARARALGEDLGVRWFTSYTACLAESGAEAVALFTPNNLHCSMTVEAARLGKHIFCEKPMAMNVGECYAMIESADRAGVRFMVGHKRRLRPQYREMARIVQSGRLGRLLTINVNGYFFRRPEGWWARRDQGGGLLALAGVHDLDFLRHLGGEVATVVARSPVKMDHRTDFEDAISLLLQFESSAVGTVQVCSHSPLRGFRDSFAVDMVLERGAVSYDPRGVTVRVQRVDDQPQTLEFDNEAGFREAYCAELDSFAGWVVEGHEPLLTGWDGLRCVEIMDAALLSSRTGREVPLPLPRSYTPEEICSFEFGGKRASAQMWAEGFAMPEGPAVDRDGSLLVANCRSDFVSRVWRDGTHERVVSTGGKVQGVAIAPDGTYYVSDIQLRQILRVNRSGEARSFCTRYVDGSQLRGPNEIAFGPNGLLYFTDPGDSWRGIPTGAFAVAGMDGRAIALAGGLEFSNGFDFAPSGDRVYVAESGSGRVLAGTLREDGTLEGGLTELVTFDGCLGPDGLRVAANGEIYVALWGHGEIAVVTPDGSIGDRIKVPGLFPTNVIFVGDDLLVCEGQTGAIWRLPVETVGMPSYAELTWTALGEVPTCGSASTFSAETAPRIDPYSPLNDSSGQKR